MLRPLLMFCKALQLACTKMNGLKVRKILTIICLESGWGEKGHLWPVLYGQPPSGTPPRIRVVLWLQAGLRPCSPYQLALFGGNTFSCWVRWLLCPPAPGRELDQTQYNAGFGTLPICRGTKYLLRFIYQGNL